MSQVQRPNFAAIHRKAAQNLENSLRHYEQTPEGVEKDFVELKLQACIFQYDINAELIAFARNKPIGFAASVALKGLVLKLYEYDDHLNQVFIPRLLALAKARNIAFDRALVKQIRLKWKAELSRISKWKDARNHAAGHYGKDFAMQVSELKNIDPQNVVAVTVAFLSFNKELLIALRIAGLGTELAS